MSYFGMSKRMYADRKAPDGIIATGWRYVKKGGRIKFGGTYYYSDKLESIVGEYVSVAMNDYWQQEVIISRGVIGCSDWFCTAVPLEK